MLSLILKLKKNTAKQQFELVCHVCTFSHSHSFPSATARQVSSSCTGLPDGMHTRQPISYLASPNNCCLVAKAVCFCLGDELGLLFRPVQLGFGTSGGCEGAVHAAHHPLVLLKVDYRNTFNSVRHDCFLHVVKEFVPLCLACLL